MFKNKTFGDLFFQQVVSDVIQYIGSGRVDEQLLFSIKLFWHGATDMIMEWIKNDMKTSPHELALRFYDNMPQTLARYYDC